ncbi:calcium-translocating P-type ATPase, PMCA-type [uncultured Odoribacter sp.]|uniref:calcium-translocating P-type ATPase, PMCA-type n=1 Tax=uncultured Odoribacter sp. TaxID=876416 RepID=UPI0026060915|nr:calcium-translocating P-type ATPase, PMCA-type [uncultured Odoribacter sp.]
MENKHYTGLSEQQVKENREKYGENLLTPPPQVPLWKLFLEKFKDPIIRILLVAAALSLIISILHNEYAETIGIIVAILLATGVGFWFEMDANRKFKLLNQVNDDILVKVIREGNIQEIPKRDIVVGDIVVLETGEEVPADGDLLEAISLQVNESTLTGEPIIDKTTNPREYDSEATYPSNRILRGTTIVNGHCIYEVKTVGDATEFGKVAEKSTEITDDKTPLSKQLERLAHFISIVGFIVAGLTFVGLLGKDIVEGFFTSENLFTLDTAGRILKYFMVAVTLIVVSVPEGLPMSVTLSLALSMRKMLKTNNLVRKMHACETMGATTVICTDKTGTLTQNQMQVYQTDFYALRDQKLAGDEISKLIKEGISVNSTAFLDYTDPEKIKTLGNPTEAALLLWLHSQGINYIDYRENASIAEQLTFSTERKYMATIVNLSEEEQILYIKGAPEIVFSKCSRVLSPEGLKPVTEYREIVEKQLLDYQNQAMRTLGFAYRTVSCKGENCIERFVENELIFLGIVAISDPVRPDVPAAVQRCLNAGIDVKIVTGDTPATAREIGRQIGIWKEGDTAEQIITGVDFEKLPETEAAQRVLKLKIMCRARPTDKQRLVDLLKQSGAIVAVTGDGTNDAPALNHADVGLSMGTGTSVAKEASDITLLDDSFNSIATAVMWGRSLYHNIQRFILFQLTINLSALLIVLIGSIFGQELPLTVTQMLWVNMIIDTFAAGALASLPPNPNVMNEKPRKATDFIITKPMRNRIIGIGLSFTFILLGLMYYFTNEEGLISRYDLSVFFTTFVMLQFWNMFNAKAFISGSSAFKGLSKSTGFLIVMVIIPIGQFLIVEFGGNVFRTVPLSLKDWGLIISLTSSVLWTGEIVRLIRKQGKKTHSSAKR